MRRLALLCTCQELLTEHLTSCLWAQGLSLDTLIADGTSTLLPNLRQLCISECQLTAAAVDSLVDTTCGRLQHVEVEGLQGERTHLTIQLQQLAFLPSLSSVSLLDSTCPTSFLGLLGARLTALHLDKSYRQRSNRSPTWRATLAHVARCTALQSLAIPCATSEELGLVAPALQRLRRLHLNGPSTRVDGDAMVERLLGLPHLTSLRWEDSHAHSFQRSHASSPCGWRELSFGSIAPHQLARLPLHSLTSPVAWDIIILEERRASVADVRAAVDNVARRCPAGSAWRRPREDTWPTLHFMALNGPTFTRGGGEGDTPAVLLRALQPLLAAPGLRQLVVVDLAWDVELVLALGEVLPRTCTGLFLMDGSLALPACLQLAKGLPWLQALVLSHMHVHPHAVSAYVGSAASTQGGVLPCGRPRLTLVRVVRPLCPEGVRDEAHWRDWEQVRDAVVGLGVGVELSLAL